MKEIKRNKNILSLFLSFLMEAEVFQAVSFPQPLNPSICKLDATLYRTYDDNNLRKVVYFMKNSDGSYKFKGDYNGTSNNGYGHSFIGIVTDEH